MYELHHLRMVTAEQMLPDQSTVVRTSSLVVQLKEEQLTQLCEKHGGKLEEIADSVRNRITEKMAIESVHKFLNEHFRDGAGVYYKFGVAFMGTGHPCLERSPNYEDGNAKVWLTNAKA